MSKSSSVIELNGNQYDKITGQLVGTVHNVAEQIRNTQSGIVDSFIRPSVATQSVHKGLERSRTLMRSAVSKPNKVTAPNKQPHQLVSPAPTISNTARRQRAKVVNKSQQVQRFSTPRTYGAHISDIGLKPAAKATPRKPAASRSNVVAATAVQPLPSMVASASHQQLERMLDRALTGANAHKNSPHGRSYNHSLWQRFKLAPKWLSIGSSLSVVALLAGFFVWQNIPQIALRVAASRAHISAAMPGYTPSGFSYAAPINYSKGAITIKYKAAGDGARTFSLTQETSNWNSKSLASNVIPPEAQVQTSQINGTTIYIYGDKNNATWVNHGMRYTLTDQANLNSDQILKIANSL